jgi:predicted nucleic acid-binding protein
LNVLVDTSVWSLALRRSRPDERIAGELARLASAGVAAIIGPIRQEILSGVRTGFTMLRDRLRVFPDVVIATADHEEAASYFNACRAKGIQGSNTDFLICAVANRRGLAIFSTDADFERFAAVLPIRLHVPKA